MVHDAYARAIKPVHTTNDGDTIFTVATGELAADPADVGSQAIVDTVAVLGTRAMERPFATPSCVRSPYAASLQQ